MDVREKLVELLYKVQDYGTKNTCGEWSVAVERKDNETVADHLIAQGVTVQDNTEISDELLKWLRNAPLTVLHEEPTIELVQDSKGVEIDPFNKWISVKDRLPDDSVAVNLHTISGVVGTGFYNKYTKSWVQWYAGNSLCVDVIHWQPLPQPPKGE